MEIIKISPRGYCYGVVDAMVIAKNASLDPNLPRPIHILGMIVHNKHVTDAFEEIGIHTLDGENREEILEQIDTGTVIFTAHGISPRVKELAKEKGLVTIDATCPDVMRTYDLILEKKAAGFQIIYIGKKGHPEPEGAYGTAPDVVHLVETTADIDALQFSEQDKIFVTNQTTMSQWDVLDLMDYIHERYPQAENHKEICMATQVRQEAVAEQAKGADLTIVVGDPRSNNTNRLAQVSEEKAGVKAYRVADVTEIELDWLKNAQKVAITAGASTPTQVIREVLIFLDQFDPADKSTWEKHHELSADSILPRAKKKNMEEKRRARLEHLKNGGR
ncbi:4-hydroxy-3-methylbut-2-enyl diphosphate reductase [Listeria aquatica]|uniref:4-hydroxy-3-methylbut-2-enyl diphosphate reductase n=1 Tax=Listeria aquatica TaxID=1494960 RepID=A0A841ZQC7_9LIST|nr:4-hydroxy-3-methylbut-2-enyl diphosphate reductase [Listeria aquatica]MBC1520841.1 4-hydroxy-3-methylbut-2-enyl diphosphate reductase [Listeria aquatica]